MSVHRVREIRLNDVGELPTGRDLLWLCVNDGCPGQAVTLDGLKDMMQTPCCGVDTTS